MKEASLLLKPIANLDLSAAFKDMASRQHFRTLQDMVNWPVSVLLLHEGFTYHIYEEFTNFLKEKSISIANRGTIICPIY